VNVAQLREALSEVPDWYEVQVQTPAPILGVPAREWASEVALEVPEGTTHPRLVIR
jgi:hypothetical protein